MVDDLVFIFFFLWMMEQTDGSAMGVKPIFYRLCMVDELVFIFFFFLSDDRVDQWKRNGSKTHFY
jgi:hypothetical protein